MTRLGKVSCGFVAFELREREGERQRRKRSKKATTQQEIGIFLWNEESSFQQAGIRGGRHILQSGLLNRSLAFPILPSTPCRGLFLLLLLLFFKELRNVFRFSFSLRTAASGGMALKSYSPEQHSAAGQRGKKNAAPSGKNQRDRVGLRVSLSSLNNNPGDLCLI